MLTDHAFTDHGILMRRVMAGEDLEPHLPFAGLAQSLAQMRTKMAASTRVSLANDVPTLLPCIISRHQVTPCKWHELFSMVSRASLHTARLPDRHQSLV